MDMQEIEGKLIAIIAAFSNKLPENEVTEMQELAKAGEPGIALENLCTQLYEYDVAVEAACLDQIAAVGDAMGIDKSNWEQLTEENG